MDSGLSYLLLRVPMILFALTVHEYMHARIAYACGDPTAKQLGRMTLNPLAHLDPMGTICLLFGPIGWAKPVPVNPLNFRSPRRDDVLVSIAGPVSNLVMAVALGLLFRAIPWDTVRAPGRGGPGAASFFHNLRLMLKIGLMINCGLAVFNMLPLFPLDGSHVLRGLLPRGARAGFESFSRYAPGVLLALILLDHFGNIRVFSAIIYPPIIFLVQFLAGPSIFT